jgi:hypothetical protein
MIELIFSVCTIVEGAACRDLPPMPLRPEATIYNCLVASQIEGAKWVVGHPNYYVYKATCRPAGAFAKI